MGSGWKSSRCERKQACNGPGFNAAERTQIAYSAEFQVRRELCAHYLLLFHRFPPVWFGLGEFIVIYSFYRLQICRNELLFKVKFT